MKLQITIKAVHPLDQRLAAELADYEPVVPINKSAGPENSKYGILNLYHETSTPDLFLEKLGVIAAEIENLFPESPAIEMLVKNLDAAEPSFSSDKKTGSPFMPVNGIRIVPLSKPEHITESPHDIILDPADAFGSGLHPSTRLCLQFLKRTADLDAGNNAAPRTVLDIGCGSGILAIAALRLGAAGVVGVEIEPRAASTARRNIEINGLAEKARIVQGSWQEVTGRFDLILANLVPSVLFRAVPAMTNLMSESGLIITSGFPAAQTEKVLLRFKTTGLHRLTESSLHGWGGLLLGHCP